MRSQPSNWYQMSNDERREWQRNQRELEDTEYEANRAREEADDNARKVHSLRNTLDQERSSWADEYNQMQEENVRLCRLLEVVGACFEANFPNTEEGVQLAINELNHRLRPDYVEVQHQEDYS